MKAHHCGIYIVALVAALHVGWAIDMWIFPVNLLATPIAPYHALFGDIRNVATVITIVSILALAAEIFCGETIWRWFWIVPQQILTMLSAWASYSAICNSHYADMVVRNPHFIFRDQWGNIATMLVHSVYMVALLAAAVRGRRHSDL